MKTWTIRPYQDDLDFDRFISGFARKRNYDILEEDWKKALRFPSSICSVAEENEKIIAVIWSRRYSQDDIQAEMVYKTNSTHSEVFEELLKVHIEKLRIDGIQSIHLDVDENEKSTLERLGFTPVSRLIHFFGDIEPKEHPACHPMNEEDLQAILLMDPLLSGYQRGKTLTSLFENNPELCYLFERHHKISAYLFARRSPTGEISVVAAHYAQDLLDAINLLNHFQACIGFQPFHLTLSDQNLVHVHKLVELGLKPDPQYRYRMTSNACETTQQMQHTLARGNASLNFS